MNKKYFGGPDYVIFLASGHGLDGGGGGAGNGPGAGSWRPLDQDHIDG